MSALYWAISPKYLEEAVCMISVTQDGVFWNVIEHVAILLHIPTPTLFLLLKTATALPHALYLLPLYALYTERECFMLAMSAKL